MFGTWTFAKRLAVGYGLAGLTLLVIAGVSYRSTSTLIENDAWVDHTCQVRRELADLLSELKDAETGQRGYIITGKESYLDPYKSALARTKAVSDDVLKLTADNPSQQRRLASLAPLMASKLAELQQTIDVRRTDGLDAAIKVVASDSGKAVMDQIRGLIAEADHEEANLLQRRAEEAKSSAQSTTAIILWGGLGGALVVAAIGWLITTSISELLATSRQIAESAQRVAQIAEQTAGNARSGHGTVDLAQDSIAGIRRQVDQIVAHMLELGKKSQEIGAVLDIVSELAEQTNILAINATIEAAGAGEAGKRFAVVADEIRKLADRVGGSTKEIRILVEEIRTAA